MTTRLRAYPAHRDSGLPWLGSIPAHWAVWQLGHFCRTGNGSTPSRANLAYWAETGTPWLNSASVHQGRITNAHRHVTELALRECHLPRVPRDSVLVAITGQGKTRGTAALLDMEATISQHVVYLHPRKELVAARYLRWLLAGAYSELRRISEGAGGTKGALTCEDVKHFRVALPPLDEQARIADFLDAHGRCVARYIRAKQRLIALLNEQKQAIIDRAVTRGLDADARMAPSGVAWLGDVPAHWAVRRLKYLVRNINEQTDRREPSEIYVALENIVSWTGAMNVDNEEVAFSSQVKRFRPGDILFGKLRPYLAKVCRPIQAGVCVGECLVLRPVSVDVSPAFLEQKLRSRRIINLINSSTYGAKMPRAEWDSIGNMLISYPPGQEEQQRLLDVLRSETAGLDAAMARVQREIALVREYRARLIADVVTGKLDVRQVAPEAPATADGEVGPDEVAAALADGEPEEAEEFEGAGDAEEGEDR